MDEPDLEKALRDIIAIGYSRGIPAARMNKMLNVAEKIIGKIDEARTAVTKPEQAEPAPF